MLQISPIRAQDEAFLFRLYASTRQAEIAAWGWDPAAQHAFLHMQWRAQALSYAAQYPDATHQIILVDDRPAGRMLIWHAEDYIRLVDIALLPEFQGRGHGTELIRALQQEAATPQKPLRLQVLQTNPARQLYERLGFVSIGESAPYVQMQWKAIPPIPGDISSR